MEQVEYDLATPTYDPVQNKWNWTVYAKRSLFKHFFVMLEFAKDHVILPDRGYY